MTPGSIKAQIGMRGWTQRLVLRKLAEIGIECTEAELSQTINGHKHRINPKIREGLAQLFGMKVEEMFDAEFDAVVAYRKAS